MKIKTLSVLSVITTLAMLLAFLGCNKSMSSSEDSDDIMDTPEKMIDAPRRDIVLTKAQETYVKAGNQFAYKWLKIVNDERKGSWFVSPMSFQFTLAMLANGASDPALTDICDVLGYGNDGIEVLDDYIKTLLSQLSDIDPNTESGIANMVLAAKGFPFTSEYKSKVSDIFNATAHEMSFSNLSAVADWVNKWTSDNTKGMITEAVSVDNLSDDLRSILGNTVYFKGKWVSRFHKGNTTDEVFTLENGTKKTILMMKQEGEFLCRQTSIYKQLTMPYGNGAYQMMVFLPLNSNTINSVIDNLQKEGTVFGEQNEADVWFPKFESETAKLSLKTHMTRLGMSVSSFLGLNYVGMQPSLIDGNISEVLHTAKIKVDEVGSEAAGVTIVTNMTGAAPPSQKKVFEFHANRPFLYIIAEVSTGAVLFAGKYDGQ